MKQEAKNDRNANYIEQYILLHVPHGVKYQTLEFKYLQHQYKFSLFAW